VSRRLLIVNVLVGALGCLFAAGLIRELGTGHPLPPAPAPRASRSAPEADGAAAGQPVPLVTYQTIATKNLFNVGRSEVIVAVAAAPPGPKPVLHGVMLDGPKSRAYLEEPPAKRVFGYAIGDPIAGGRLDSIGPDRVVIIRPDGPVEVLLHDPSKPRPVAPTAAGPAVQRVPAEPARAPGAAPALGAAPGPSAGTVPSPGGVPTQTPRQALPR
jgi:hypothetical protein